jgi:hypothetical protein
MSLVTHGKSAYELLMFQQCAVISYMILMGTHGLLKPDPFSDE